MLGGFEARLTANVKGLQTGLRKASGMLKGFSSEVKQTVPNTCLLYTSDAADE